MQILKHKVMIVAILLGIFWVTFVLVIWGVEIDLAINISVILWVLFIIIAIICLIFDAISKKDEKLKDLQLNSLNDGNDRALSIIDKLKWTPTGSMQSRDKRYISMRCAPNDIEDFDWLVKYISYSGCHAELLASGTDAKSVISNPYALMQKTIGDSTFQCDKVNSDYTITAIYRFPNTVLENTRINELRYVKYSSDRNNAEKIVPVGKSVGLAKNTDTDIRALHNTQDLQKAVDILNIQQWEKLKGLDKGRVQYVCRKENAPNKDDFKWVVGYLSGSGTPENPKNPHTYVVTELDGVEYKSIKVNKFFESTVIYKMGETASTSSEVFRENVCNPDEKLIRSKFSYLVENRLKENSVFQYNLQLIEDYKREIKEKIEEYNSLKSQKDDETLISLSVTGMVDFEELNEQLDDLREEIEDLKADIEDLNEENNQIREDLKEKIEDEMWNNE